MNTTDSAVRITHLPTGIVVSLPEREEPAAEQGAGAAHPARAAAGRRPGSRRTPRRRRARRSQVRTVDRSERIRTYNYPENRISDHRTGYKAYNLDQVLDGALERRRDRPSGSRPAARLDARRPAGLVSPTDRAGRVLPTAAARSLRGRRRLARGATPGLLLAHVLGVERSRLLLDPAVDRVRPTAFAALVAAPRSAGAAAAPDRRRALPPRRAVRSAPASSCPGRRPSCSPAGRSIGSAS